MKAIIREHSGKEFSGMKLKEIESPIPGANEVKIKMASSRINPVDMDLMKGMPFLKYKKPQIGGIDGAGTILQLGSGVKNFKVGDNVFFYRKFSDIGTWAEEITIDSSFIATIPAHLSLLQSGGIALPLLTAFDSLSNLNSKPGEKILIHAGGGGVGFCAIQIAKKMGLNVTCTVGTEDTDLLLSKGVEKVIDYKKDKFFEIIQPNHIDYIFDLIGGEVLKQSILLKPKKIISVHYVDPSKMDRVGMSIPGILKWILKLSTKKYDSLALKNSVQLIGQVTGGNGLLLQKASDFVNYKEFSVREQKAIFLSDIVKNPLNKKDIGKIIRFE